MSGERRNWSLKQIRRRRRTKKFLLSPSLNCRFSPRPFAVYTAIEARACGGQKTNADCNSQACLSYTCVCCATTKGSRDLAGKGVLERRERERERERERGKEGSCGKEEGGNNPRRRVSVCVLCLAHGRIVFFFQRSFAKKPKAQRETRTRRRSFAC